MFLFGMHPGADDSQAIQGRNTQRACEIAVTAATELPVAQLQADIPCHPLGRLQAAVFPTFLLAAIFKGLIDVVPVFG